MKRTRAILIILLTLLAIAAIAACAAPESPSNSSTTVEVIKEVPVEVEVVREVEVVKEVPVEVEIVKEVEVVKEVPVEVEVEIVKEVEVVKEAPVEVEVEVVREVEVGKAVAAGAAMPASPASSSTEYYESASPLKAGETDDNQQWSAYMDFVTGFGEYSHSTPLDHRFIVAVADAQGTPIPGALVTISHDREELARGVTYANGQTIFHPEGPLPESYTVTVSRDATTAEQVFSTLEDVWQVTLMDEFNRPEAVPLDVLFLLDSTGSMADEIHRIKATLLSIADQVGSLEISAALRFGMVAYRDRDDDYITRVYDFDADITRFSQAVAEVEADGGGDTPESLNEALHVALNEPDWRGDNTIKLVFLVADAPPHLDYANDYNYAEEMVNARERGIKIFSVASSGLDQQGEYIFRQIAQQTMGKFIFILYDDGAGGLDTPHDVDQFTVNRLDQLIVRLIREELESANPQAS